jgi:hypothetical protein
MEMKAGVLLSVLLGMQVSCSGAHFARSYVWDEHKWSNEWE